MKEHHLSVDRTARYFTTGPATGVREVWFVLHGYAQLASDFISYFNPLDDGTRLIVAPEALSRFYARGFGGQPAASWMTSEDRLNEITDYTAYLERLAVIVMEANPQARIVVCGFSQGVTSASRWIHSSRFHIAHFILYAGEIGRELQNPLSPRIASIPLTYVTGTQDRMISQEKKEEVLALMKSLHAGIITFEGRHEVKADVVAGLGNIPFAQ